MNNKRRALIALLTAVFVLLAACGNSTDESIDHTNSESTDSSTTQNENEDSSNNKTEKPNEDKDSTGLNEQAESSDHSTPNSKDKSQKPNNDENDTHVSKKEEYLKKLEDTKRKTDNMEATDSSTYALKKVEDDRWDIWDDLLNEIYGVLKEQLSAEEMDQLQKEQRDWIKYRDDTALKASHKFKGGTQEHLEYSAVAANVTEERCYQLVEKYM